MSSTRRNVIWPKGTQVSKNLSTQAELSQLEKALAGEGALGALKIKRCFIGNEPSQQNDFCAIKQLFALIVKYKPLSLSFNNCSFSNSDLFYTQLINFLKNNSFEEGAVINLNHMDLSDATANQLIDATADHWKKILDLECNAAVSAETLARTETQIISNLFNIFGLFKSNQLGVSDSQYYDPNLTLECLAGYLDVEKEYKMFFDNSKPTRIISFSKPGVYEYRLNEYGK